MKAILRTEIALNWEAAKEVITPLEAKGIEPHVKQVGSEIIINWAELESDYQEASIILAALRILQDKIEDGSLKDMRKLPHFDDVAPLTSEQIDELCEQLNCD